MPLQAQQLGENDDVQLAALFAQRRRLDEGARQEFFSRVMSDAETKATKGGRRKRRPPRPRAAAEATTSSPDVNLSEESQPGRGRSPFVSPRPRPAASMEGLEALLTLKRRAPLLSQEVEGLLLELSKPMVPEAEAACCRLLQRCTESARFAREAVAEGAEEELSEMDTEALRGKMFPPGFPNGWHCVCNATDLADGQVKSISALGTYMVAFRGQDGKVGVTHAFCPHMGAHLGMGGVVVGNSLQCPFHGWSFNVAGDCVSVPYRRCNRDMPESSKLHAYEVREHLERIFIWFDAEGRPPQWELTCHEKLEEDLQTGSFYLAAIRQMEFDQHCCEMHMNSADPYHFKTLHAPLPLPVLEKFITADHTATQEYGKGVVNEEPKDEWHMASFEERTHGLFLFGHPRLPVPLSATISESIETNVTFEGPTIVHFRIKTPLGVLRQVKTILPIEPFKQYVEARWYAERSVPRLIACALACIGGRALEQDREVWENKVYHKKPVLVAGDGAFLEFMRWYDQFYSEKSASLCYDW